MGRRRRDAVDMNGTSTTILSNASTPTASDLSADDEEEDLQTIGTIVLEDRADSDEENVTGVEVLDVCMSSGEYYALVVMIGICVIVLVVVSIVSAACIRSKS